MQYKSTSNAYKGTRFYAGAYSYQITNGTTVTALPDDAGKAAASGSDAAGGILHHGEKNTSGDFKLQWTCTDAASAVGKLTLTMGKDSSFTYTGLDAAAVFGGKTAAQNVYFSFSTWLPAFNTANDVVETGSATKIAVDRAYYTDTAGSSGSTLGVATAYFIDTDGNDSYETQLKDTTMVSADQTILCRKTITNKNKAAASSFSTSLLIPSLKSYAGSDDTKGTLINSIANQTLYWHEHGATGETEMKSSLASYGAGPLNSTAPYTNYATVSLPAGGDGTSAYDGAYAVYEYTFTLGASVTRLAQSIQIGVAPFTPAVISSSISFNTPMAFNVEKSGGVQYSADGTGGVAVYKVMAKGKADATLLKADVNTSRVYDEAWLNGTDANSYLGKYFSAAEQAALLNDPGLSAKLVFPSQEEVTGWGLTTYASRVVGSGKDWWLRNAVDGSTHMGVAADGTVITTGYADSDAHGVRPALRLNLADVLLTVPAATKAASAAPGPDALTALAAEEANTVWKLTLLDTADAFRLAQDGGSQTVNTGSTLSFTYSGFTPGEKRYISAILADNTGKDLYYGQLAKPNSAAGTVSCRAPAALSNGDYILKIFAETIDTAKATDVGSQIQTVRLSVGNNLEGAVAVSGTAEYGCALTATVSGDNHLGTLAYQWTRNGAEIAGATDSSYTATADDIGKTLACVVTDTSESESGSHRSNSIVSHGVTVEKRTLTFRADDKSIFTGGALPAFTVGCAGFVNGDTQETIVSSLGTAACAADGKTAGTFPITVTGSALSGSGNAQHYRISTVNGVLTVNTPASSSSVTVPVSSDAGKADVSATVTGGTAAIAVTDSQLRTIVSDAGGTGTVKVDVSGLKNVTAASIPAKIVEAAKTGGAGLAVRVPNGSVALDSTALGAVSTGGSVVVSVEPVAHSAIVGTQKTVVPENAVIVDVNVLVSGTKVHDFNGGTITLSVPYTPATGENTAALTVWYLDDAGGVTPMNGHYDATSGAVVFTATHLSRYVIARFPFADVAGNSYAYTPVAWAVQTGVAQGVGTASFSPDGVCTRAQAVTFLWRAMGSPEPTGAVSPFADADKVAWYYKAVLWATEKGIAVGTTASTFSPDETVTRAQAVTFLHRAAGKPASGGVNAFADVDSAAYYYSAVRWAAETGVTGGTSAAAFSPAAPCTRAQIVTFLYRQFGK